MKLALPICITLALASLAVAPLSESFSDRLALVPDDILISFDEVGMDSNWVTVNDGVMGGKSTGGFSIDGGRLLFKGSTNTDGGGFSSIRTRSTDLKLDGTEGLLLRVRGDGRTYISGLRNGTKLGGYDISYWARFETTGDWQTVRIPYADYTPTFFGENITGRAPELRADEITAAEFYIYDKQDGPFKLEIEWIGTWTAADDTPDAPKEDGPVAANQPDDHDTSPDHETARWATSVLALAIERGVPQFNHGNHQACADLYELAIRSLLTGPASLPGDATSLLQSGIDAGHRAASHRDRAWAYRYAIDAALESLATDRMHMPSVQANRAGSTP